MSNLNIIEEIKKLKAERGAVILAHNYQRAEVQEVADFTGDSLELARKATEIDADVIVFCGVYFMAETAAVLNPTKTVLIPDRVAGCPMADMIKASELRKLKAEHPGAIAVCYVNSTAEVKAECDVTVTSGNAKKVLSQLPQDRKVIFVPDCNLGSHISDLLGRDYILWPGFCPVHAKITKSDIEEARKAHPSAIVLVHPECPKDVRDASDEKLSTGGMCAFARDSKVREFIVGTEVGILHRLRNENPDAKFYPVREDIVCEDMKLTTLESLRDSLKYMKDRVQVDEAVALRAKNAIQAMLELS
ncbi:MAG: quinolinate synthase NadA [Kiritimatiellae bacterium]|nr:quinolinate synthase NadA [Kiritimatiellia bacterium]